jgi:hypothetical protein
MGYLKVLGVVVGYSRGTHGVLTPIHTAPGFSEFRHCSLGLGGPRLRPVSQLAGCSRGTHGVLTGYSQGTHGVPDRTPRGYSLTHGVLPRAVRAQFGHRFRRGRGMYFSRDDRGMFGSMVHNWPHDDVRAPLRAVDCRARRCRGGANARTQANTMRTRERNHPHKRTKRQPDHEQSEVAKEARREPTRGRDKQTHPNGKQTHTHRHARADSPRAHCSGAKAYL